MEIRKRVGKGRNCHVVSTSSDGMKKSPRRSCLHEGWCWMKGRRVLSTRMEVVQEGVEICSERWATAREVESNSSSVEWREGVEVQSSGVDDVQTVLSL